MNKIEIYVHIPFCVRKCLYCDFLSGEIRGGEDEVRTYIDALCREIELKRDMAEDHEVSSVFFGGGTPSCIDAKHIWRVMECIRMNYRICPDAEITREANPRTLDANKLKTYRMMGINRISLGAQSFKDDELQNLGRIHNADQIRQSVDLIKDAGFENFNIDLMMAIPGQDFDSYKSTLEEAVSLEPKHISAYSLIIEPGTKFYDIYGDGDKPCGCADSSAELSQAALLPDEDTERDMYHYTVKYLKENGYDQYEISNFSKPGFECDHNIGYWVRREYLGFGLGAASLVGNKRFSELTGDEELDERDCMSETMILGLRMNAGVGKEEFKATYNKDIYDVYGREIKSLVDQGLLIDDRENIYLSERGFDLANYAFGYFI